MLHVSSCFVNGVHFHSICLLWDHSLCNIKRGWFSEENAFFINFNGHMHLFTTFLWGWGMFSYLFGLAYYYCRSSEILTPTKIIILFCISLLLVNFKWLVIIAQVIHFHSKLSDITTQQTKLGLFCYSIAMTHASHIKWVNIFIKIYYSWWGFLSWQVFQIIILSFGTKYWIIPIFEIFNLSGITTLSLYTLILAYI